MTDETAAIGRPRSKRGGGVLPWLLFLVTAGAGGYLFWTAHRPLVDSVQKKDAKIEELNKLVADALVDAKAHEETQRALAAAEAKLTELKAELEQSTSKKAEDERLLAELKQKLNGAEVQSAAGEITVTLVDRILFKSGEAALTPEGEELLRKLGAVLTGANKLIEVSGHADNQPVESARKLQFPTNWELSATRATNVVRFLQEQVGIKSRQLKAAGYSDSRPVASNATAAGRAKNRRIEILLLPDKVKIVKAAVDDKVAVATAKRKPASAPKKR